MIFGESDIKKKKKKSQISVDSHMLSYIITWKIMDKKVAARRYAAPASLYLIL